MGRFFPKANKEEIILNFKEQASTSYNEYFVYPTGGAIEYINSLYKNVDDTKVSLNEKVIKIDIHIIAKGILHMKKTNLLAF